MSLSLSLSLVARTFWHTKNFKRFIYALLRPFCHFERSEKSKEFKIRFVFGYFANAQYDKFRQKLKFDSLPHSNFKAKIQIFHSKFKAFYKFNSFYNFISNFKPYTRLFHIFTPSFCSVFTDKFNTKDIQWQSFKKKIIIGSVLGFVATAIGLVAVFFPSVFNLEKQRIEEKTFFLHTQRDADELFEWLKNKQDKIVKLIIVHCCGEFDNTIGDDRLRYGETKFGEPNKYGAPPFWINSGITLGLDTVSMMREDGFIQLGNTPAEIRFPKMRNDAVYEYYISAELYEDKALNQKTHQICGSLNQKVSALWGTFYVNVENGDGLIIFTLDPMSKKDLKLRNY